jgi:signal transduction histidine kinase
MPNGGHMVIKTDNVELDKADIGDMEAQAEGQYVMLSLRDTGSGMDAATQARIFEPFFTTKTPGKGTGLGLATVFGIVKQNFGHIVVDTELKRGTIFRIYFPRSD